MFNLTQVTQVFAEDNSKKIDLSNIDQSKIDTLVNNIISKSKIPGASIVLINKDQTKYLTYGYANKKQNKKMAQDTLVEIGSMSKAFTGLGLLLLEDQGKISLDDPITKYIPWLHFYYKGTYKGQTIDGEVELTIKNFLYQTSGIPFNSIGNIPEGTTGHLLEETVRTLIGTNLDFYPGDKYQYATINYDVLGYIIQIVSGQTYEEFISENIIKPLGLKNTYLFQEQAQATGLLAQGYKLSFFQAIPYTAPRYRGDTPSGYIFSNATDLEHWMKIQMGLIEVSEQYKKIIEKSHIGDTTVISHGMYYYAAGWDVSIREEDIGHEGNNPNYSCVLLMKKEEQLGICILTNMNSNAAKYLAANIINVIKGTNVTRYKSDIYKSLDFAFSIIVMVTIMLGCVFIVLLSIAVTELFIKKRCRERIKGAKVADILLAIPFIVFLGFCLYYLPNILFYRLSWDAVKVWGSPSIFLGCLFVFISFTLFISYVLLTFNFPKNKEKGYFSLIILTLINGFSSGLIIFTISESFNRNLEYSKELLVYFVFSLLFFVYTLKLLQGRLIVITNEIAYEKRMYMINKIMCSSYQAIEGIGRDRIFSGLNNDSSAISQAPGIIIWLVSNILTLIFCLSYLLTKSVWAFLASFSVIILSGIISFITSRLAAKQWEKNRDVQDIYFGQMQDLVNGFKELVLNKLRRFAFWSDIKKYSRMSTELNKSASIKFMNFGLYNTLMYNIVFGVVVFVFPIFMLNLDVNQLRENLFIVFYMVGPFGAIAGAVPQITQLNVNLKRINKLITDLDEISTGDETIELGARISYPKDISIEFKDVVYKYKQKEGQKEENEFTLGPINAKFKSGEVVFITGGNGSGKSTLGKLITGLYTPLEGKILINGKNAELREQNELFSSVYSDFNLFKKLYGIDYQKKKDITMKYLDMMKMKDKVEINDEGEFTSLELSTGQKKRLAFIVSCLEDKPMVIFDEWAAEQDPESRYYFYNDLLPMLRNQGKGIIVITHDDRYFHLADKMMKLESGIGGNT